MHFFNMFGILFVAIWIVGGMVIFREARLHNPVVRLMATCAIVLGPLGMLIYLGFRYIGQSIQIAGLLHGPRNVHN